MGSIEKLNEIIEKVSNARTEVVLYSLFLDYKMIVDYEAKNEKYHHKFRKIKCRN